MAKRSLIIQGARFGDLVQTKRLIVSAGANRKIALVADARLKELAAIIYPDTEFYGINFHGAPSREGVIENSTIFGELREQDFAEIYNCNFSPLTTSLCRLFPEDKIINYRPARDSAGGISRGPWARLIFRLSRFRKSTPLNIADFWGWLAPFPIEGEKINPVAIPGGKGLGITLAGRNARRSLPPEILAKIAALVDSVLKPGEIRLFGAATEKRLARELILSLPASPRNKINDLTGATGWKDLAEQLTGLDLLLAPDTGTAHLAACLGVPVMAFFLSSALCHETGPYGLGHTVWQASGSCVPCIESAACPIETKCLLPFASRDFYRSLTEFLKEGRPPAKLPDGLLFYQPKFDELGIEFIAAAGNDEYAKKRAYARLLVKNWLRLKTPLDNEAALINEFRDYIGELFPEDEWALPPERYS